MKRVIPLIVAVSSLLHATRAGAQDKDQLDIGGGRIDVIFSSAPAAPLRKLILAWVASSARAVTVYYEQFPVSHLQLRVRFFDGHGVRGGRTTGWDGALISIAVGRSSTAADFSEDWVLTHEMVHLAFPSVPDRRASARIAATRRSRPGFHAHMGPNLLGWGALLFAGRYRNSQAHWKQEGPGGAVSSHS